jgi:regulator of sigma E protease
VTPAADAAGPEPEPVPPPLTPLQWLRANGPILLLLAGFAGWLYVKFGWPGLWQTLLAAVGVGLVIFVHELGHFLAAKWCDVHVLTFSIGFGPAIPGCSFRRGETLYKLALIPLGGYVNMVGEGSETEEGEDYPRSFKNKSVYQRMFIISAGVVMNVILGCVCFVTVYRLHGEPRQPGVVARVEPGSPAWRAGVRSGSDITRIGNVRDPWWEDLKAAVAFSSAGEKIPFTFETADGQVLTTDLVPRSEEGDSAPVIGVAGPNKLTLISRQARGRNSPLPAVAAATAAAAARAVDLRPGDVPVAATDPEKGGAVTDLPSRAAPALEELGRRVRRLAGKELQVVVRRGGEKVTLPAAAGFDFEDRVVGCTDPAEADAFKVKSVLRTGSSDEAGEDWRDYFTFQRRMQQLAGRTVLVQVLRHKGPPEPVTILVPPAYQHTFGLRMAMGEVAAVRDASPAKAAGVAAGDRLLRAVVTENAGGKELLRLSEPDPTRLPLTLREAAARADGAVRVTLTVLRLGGPELNKEVTLPPADWDDSRRYDEETPISARSPMAIPELGIAYRVESRVAEVYPTVGGQPSPAAGAGLQAGDVIEQIRFRRPTESGKPPKWERWTDLKSKSPRGPDENTYDQWALIFTSLVAQDDYDVQVKVRRGKELVALPQGDDEGPALTAVEDPTWPVARRGLAFQPLTRLQKADSTLAALGMGVQRTGDFIRQILMGLRSLVTRRVSTDQLAGPVDIAVIAFEAAGQDPYQLLLFLGMISVNLAVVNFLPIPVLDGGHMVFLVYEWIRGRKPPEGVQNSATYVGVAFILSLMVFVIYLGLKRWVF